LEVVELAVAALRESGLEAREARRWVARALVGEPEREWEVCELVREALRLRPEQAA